MTTVGSSYLLMAAATVVQVIMVPLYLDSFGPYQFGVLMILLNMINLAVVGIAWISGGALRLLGEYAGRDDEDGFCRSFSVIRVIYTVYGGALAAAAACAAFGFSDVLFSGGSMVDVQMARPTLLLAGIYLIFFYIASVDRLALTARKCQSTANVAQIAGVIVSALGAGAWVLTGGKMPGVIAFHIVGALVSVLISQSCLRQELSRPLKLLPSPRDWSSVRTLGGSTGSGFFLHGILMLALFSDVALIGWLGGAEVAAEFYLVWKIAEVFVQAIWKVSEPLAPYFIHMEVKGDSDAIVRTAQQGYMLVAGLSLCLAVFYAVFGMNLVALWVEPGQVPQDPFAFLLAGGAIFWLASARLPIVFASAKVALRPLNTVGVVELLSKLFVTVALFPRVGYLAVLLGINVVHLLGASVSYYRLLHIRTSYRVVSDVSSSGR